MPLNIAVDVDEVLAAFIPGLCNFHNEHYNTTLTPSSFRSYRFCEVWGGDDDEAITKVHSFFKTSHFLNMEPIRGAKQGIQALRSRGHCLSIVTSRQLIIEEETRAWLDKHFGAETFDSIHFGNHWGVKGRKISKADLCESVNAHVLIDDSTQYASNVASVGIEAILFDLDGQYAWNTEHVEKDNDKITRVTDWDGVVQLIDSLETKLRA